ncbi:MAG TPA: CoA pyrophosphatase, partial [Actinomycetota bacterium]|nr:CoA pyrophosphatase [Actinomycetota bacterium]
MWPILVAGLKSALPETARHARCGIIDLRALARRGLCRFSMTLELFDLPPREQLTWLRERLQRPAPADALNLSDGFRLPGREGAPTPAAVLVPLVDRDEGLTVLFTERSLDLPDHPGQISFPGGRVEPEDRDAGVAALREAYEEVGLARERVTLLGRLAEYETVTGYRVTPVVGWVEPPFEVTPDPVEVA